MPAFDAVREQLAIFDQIERDDKNKEDIGMTAIAILLLAAAIAFGLSRLLRLPAIPLLLLGGASLNALAGYVDYKVPQELIAEMIQIGLAVLVFTAGVG